MTSPTTLVLGGTGITGRRVVQHLRAQGTPARAASRSGDTTFDWTDRATWRPALDGADAAYIVALDTTPSPTPAFVAEAVASGVERLVLLSARGVDVPGYFAPGFDGAPPHLAGEAAVRDSGVPWTILRPGWFAQNFSEGVFRDGVLAGELALPTGDGAGAFVDADDIAAVAVAALTGPGHAGEVYELSGPRALTIDGVLAAIAAAGGPTARYVPASDAEFRKRLVAEWGDEEAADLWTSALHPIRTSQEAPATDGVKRALGREPRGIEEFAAAAVAAGAWRG
ncbi:uncharacterized protein YbjT (DUF2867 family) [Murinocardiopsis flavida]|uniref:Uncharacterized protein YbjT (DUF2867 family) n=1 Tax=Murinocardiopsis flavida TaxID=645275 RepID=A0A2P8CSX7_9ACTN|nr:NAD(P)H-binding protein [Murinocardiopsis flavida]PSK88068.1 uncharacterized protein YbjT (DUF2867 family) [Murinocardiopsis flavida]